MTTEPYGRVKMMIALRVLIGATLLLGTAFPLYLTLRTNLALQLFKFVTIMLSLSLVYAILLDRVRNLVFFAYCQIVIDVFLETLVIAQTGGIESPFSILYIFTIISGSIVLMGQASFLIALQCALLYGWLVITETLNLLPIAPLPADYPLPKLNVPHSYVAYVVGVNLFGFLVVALLSNYLSERLRRTDALLMRQIDHMSDLRFLNENIVQSMSSGLLITDLGGQITFANRAAAEILSLDSRSDTPLRRIADILPPGFWEEALANLERGTPGPLAVTETPLENEDGEILLGITATVLGGRRGQVRGLMFLLEDWTERVELEVQKRKAEKLAGVADLSARMAHEIRNPLASMSGSIEILRDSLELGATERRLMDIVLRESDRLNQLISQFLSYARPKPPEFRTVDVRELLTDVVELLRHHPHCGDGVEVRLETPTERLAASVDPRQFQQVLWNLGINALEAMPAGGLLGVRADRAPPELFLGRGRGRGRAAADSPVRAVSMVRMEFRDSGVGMTAEQLRQIFHPFTSFKEGGTGIGLAIAYRIVENHGGMIRVESQPGQGSVFTIFVPAVVELPPADRLEPRRG